MNDEEEFLFMIFELLPLAILMAIVCTIALPFVLIWYLIRRLKTMNESKSETQVEVIGRPYGDLPSQGFYITENPPIGTILTVKKEWSETGSYLLSDGFCYPASSVKLLGS